ncbi:hypothetical protein BFJ72_g15282, partial [Fusarium proliferatum]
LDERRFACVLEVIPQQSPARLAALEPIVQRGHLAGWPLLPAFADRVGLHSDLSPLEGAARLDDPAASLLHFSGKDRERADLLRQMAAMQARGLKQLLMLSGDRLPGHHPGQAPVRYLESVPALQIAREHGPGRGQPDGARLALGDRVHQSGRGRLRRADHAPARDQLQRKLGPGEPGQALGAQGARNDADLHLGKAQARLGLRHAVVAGHGQLQAAAEHRAVQRHDHGARLRLEAGQEGVEARRRETGLLEGRDVGAGHPGAPAAVQHERVQVGGRLELLQCGCQPVDDGDGQGVDRRIVDLDQADAAVAGEGDGRGHGGRRGAVRAWVLFENLAFGTETPPARADGPVTTLLRGRTPGPLAAGVARGSCFVSPCKLSTTIYNRAHYPASARGPE